jgi:hypothetical protein
MLIAHLAGPRHFEAHFASWSVGSREESIKILPDSGSIHASNAFFAVSLGAANMRERKKSKTHVQRGDEQNQW